MVKMLVNSGVTLRREDTEATKRARATVKDAPAVFHRVKPEVGKTFDFEQSEIDSILSVTPDALSKPEKGAEEGKAVVENSQGVVQQPSALTPPASNAPTTAPAPSGAASGNKPARGNPAASGDTDGI